MKTPSYSGVQTHESWPKHDVGGMSDFAHGGCVSSCEASVQKGFLRKVFGIVAAQLLVTGAMCALFMFEPHVRSFVLNTPSMLFVTFLASIGLLISAQANKDVHPLNLQLTLGFTVSMAWSVGVVCARFYESGMGLVVLEAVGLTAGTTAGLTAYTLNSKKDFSFLGAGLGASLWVLIGGGLVASLTGMAGMHLALAVGGAAIFSLYIVYDVHMIAKRLSPDEYIPAAISLYLDIINLFLHLLRILAELQGRSD